MWKLFATTEWDWPALAGQVWASLPDGVSLALTDPWGSEFILTEVGEDHARGQSDSYPVLHPVTQPRALFVRP